MQSIITFDRQIVCVYSVCESLDFGYVTTLSLAFGHVTTLSLDFGHVTTLSLGFGHVTTLSLGFGHLLQLCCSLKLAHRRQLPVVTGVVVPFSIVRVHA